MEFLIIGVIIVFVLNYNRIVDTNRFITDTEPYFRALMEDDYVFLLGIRYPGRELDINQLRLQKEEVKIPDGVAHFLEHKMFEQKDGKDPFTFYSERGCDANANTSNYKTTYLFSGANSFADNINFLLDYVQDPYFTDENVEELENKIEKLIEEKINEYYV